MFFNRLLSKNIAGLIFTERKGKFLTARINRAVLDELKTLLTFPLN